MTKYGKIHFFQYFLYEIQGQVFNSVMFALILEEHELKLENSNPEFSRGESSIFSKEGLLFRIY